jgi:hypothetical protein
VTETLETSEVVDLATLDLERDEVWDPLRADLVAKVGEETADVILVAAARRRMAAVNEQIAEATWLSERAGSRVRLIAKVLVVTLWLWVLVLASLFW